MKRIFAILLSSTLASVAFANPVAQTTTAAPTTTMQQQPVVVGQEQAPVNAAPVTTTNQVQHKKPKPQKPKFSRNSIWCGDTHIKNNNADDLSDVCHKFSYKHKVATFWDNHSERMVSCRIKDTGEINLATCNPTR